MHNFLKIEDYLAGEMARKRIPGLSLAIVKDGQTLIKKHYGLANVELAAPVTDGTVYEIASITKSFTAFAIMLLAEDGRLRLDDPLARFLPGLPAHWVGLTVRHLLTHTSGIENWTLDWSRPDITPEVVAEALFGPPLLFAPGAQSSYSDANYNLLGMLISGLTGMTYDAFLQARVLGPLAMTATRHNDVRAIVPGRAEGYDYAGEALARSGRILWEHINLSPDVPANGANGSLLSTLDDLLRWDAEWTRPTLLPAMRMAQMTTPAVLTNGTLTTRGIGCEVENYHGHMLVEFAGGVPGFTTTLSRFVNERLTVILLTNQDSKPWDMARVAAGLFEPALAR